MQAIQFQNVSCYYKNKKETICALKNINFDVAQGEFVVVVGESGSGKSTLLKSCMGLINYFEGDILIGGVKVENIQVKHANYAYVSQQLGLAPNFTVFDNIAFPLVNIKTSHEEVEKRVEQVASQLGIKFLLTRKPRQLSGGQQQRVAIARAIVKNPSYMFFDEPFANIQPQLRVELRQLVKKLSTAYGCTTLFVTHDIAEAFAIADKIVVLENGSVAQIGTPQQIKSNPTSELIKAYLENSIF